jgi:general secretion pathway protein H
VPEGTLPQQWLHQETMVLGGTRVVLGPEPIIGAQQVVIGTTQGRTLRIVTDGLRPFTIVEAAGP